MDEEQLFTTIRISKETAEWLESLKIHPREPYDDVLKRLKTGVSQ